MNILEAYENIDRERLENVNLDSMYPRGQGRTFAFAMNMLGAAHVGPPSGTYLYIGERIDYAKHVMRQFCEMLKAEGMEVRPEPDRGYLDVLSPIPCRFYWIGPDPRKIERMTRGGQWTDVYVDLTYDLVDRARREIETLKYSLECYRERQSTH